MSAPEIKLDDDDDFDVSFFEEIERLEKTATQNRRHHQPPPPQPPPHQPYFSPAPPLPPQPPSFHHFPASTAAAAVDDINYSPPRELSQRFTSAAAAANNSSSSISVNTSFSGTSTRSSRSPVTPPNSEIDIVKGDLIRVTKELSDVKEENSLLKKENSLLKKERDKKKQHIVVHPDSKTVSRDAEASLVQPRNGASLRRENSKPVAQSGPTQAKTEQKSVGIQTDTCDEPASPSISGTASSFSGRPKLLEIWSSSSSHCSQRKFVTKMLETSATDFCYLFGFMGLNVTSTTIQDCLTHIPLTKTIQDSNSDEVRRVSQLYSVLNKLSNNTVHISAFMDILLDLCEVDNALVVHRSLRILRVAVRYLLSSQRIRPRRDNVHAEKSPSASNNEHMLGFDLGRNDIMCDTHRDEASSAHSVPAFKIISTAEHDATTHIDWLHIFTFMCQTAVTMTEEHVKAEAITVMNIIVRGTDPYSERRRFGERFVFVAVANLLKKDAGLFCQKEAIHLVYLLLNCPNLLASFCSSCKETEGDISENDGAGNCTYQTSCAILEGFAGCVHCNEHSLKELSLCRNAVLVLAFLASSGKSGLDIFLFCKLSNGGNFLGLILRALASEIDAETLESCPSPEIYRERTLLMREALILLNRLVSHPAYATSVLKVLTSSRDIVSLAINVATSLSKKSHAPPNSDVLTKQMRSEVVEWATVFKKRIVTFLREAT